MRKANQILLICALSIIIFGTRSLLSYDFPHFYRASYFFGEPRLEKAQLTSIDFTLSGGFTHKARNCNGQSVCLFDIYGPSNMKKIGAGIPCKDPTSPVDLAMTYLSQVPGRDGFGFLSYNGKFSLMEGIFSFTQNISHGLFLQLLVPVKKMSVKNVCSIDLSPHDNAWPNINHPYWQMFLNQFSSILAKYHLSIQDWKYTGVGDISFLAGFTCNYQDTIVLDYIDFDFKCGVLAPSGRERSLYYVFDIPPGYDGHIAIPLQLDCSLGLFDWFTAGLHADVLPFLSKTKEVRMKTDYNQSGPIKLAKGCALEKIGPLFNIGCYLKADHFAQGLSLLVGYSYNKKYKDELTPQDACLFDQCIVNSDAALQEWDMHTIHFLAEYDFATEGKRLSPHINVFYNWQIAGKNVLRTSMAGGTFGFDIAWYY